MFHNLHQLLPRGLISPHFKVFLLIIAAVSHYVGLKPPNPPPTKQDVVYKGQFLEKVVRLLAFTCQVTTITTLGCECVMLLSLYYSNPYSQRSLEIICPHPSPSLFTNIPVLSPSFLLGVAIMLSSAALRVWCFNALGGLFTFEVTIRPEHRLITSGPYAYVRHPSYTGGALMLIGAAVTCFASGSFVNECHIMTTTARWFIRLWFLIAVYATVSLWRRGRVEDEGLRKVFGESWDSYSRVVPCRYIPFVF